MNVKKTIAFAEFEKLHPPEKKSNLSIRSDSVKRSRSSEDTAADNSTVDQLNDSFEDEGDTKDSISPLPPIIKRVKSPSPTRESSEADKSNSKRVRRTDSSPRISNPVREANSISISNPAKISPNEGPLPPSPTLTASSIEMPTSTTSRADEQEVTVPVSGLIDIRKVSNNPDKNLVPECILAVFPRKKTMYCLVELKLDGGGMVQLLEAEYVR